MRPAADPIFASPTLNMLSHSVESKGHDFPHSPYPVRRTRLCTPSSASLAVVASLLETRAITDVNKKTQVDGETPLSLAVKHGHKDVALALVRAGGDVNLTDTSGMSPLICAVSFGRAELVNDLLLSGSRVDAKDNGGDTALSIAVRRGDLGIVKTLLQAGACLDTRDEVIFFTSDRLGGPCCGRQKNV